MDINPHEFIRIHVNSYDFEWNRMNSRSEIDRFHMISMNSIEIIEIFWYRFFGYFLQIVKNFMLLIQFFKIHMNSCNFILNFLPSKYEIAWFHSNSFDFDRIQMIFHACFLFLFYIQFSLIKTWKMSLILVSESIFDKKFYYDRLGLASLLKHRKEEKEEI